MAEDQNADQNKGLLSLDAARTEAELVLRLSPQVARLIDGYMRTNEPSKPPLGETGHLEFASHYLASVEKQRPEIYAMMVDQAASFQNLTACLAPSYVNIDRRWAIPESRLGTRASQAHSETAWMSALDSARTTAEGLVDHIVNQAEAKPPRGRYSDDFMAVANAVAEEMDEREFHMDLHEKADAAAALMQCSLHTLNLKRKEPDLRSLDITFNLRQIIKKDQAANTSGGK